MNLWMRQALVAVFLFTSVEASAGDATGAKAYVDTVAKQVLDVLKVETAQSTKQQKLVQIFSTTVDIEFVGKFVLGRHWKEATPEQQKAYLTAYEPFILNNYAKKLIRYSGQNYKLREARDAGGQYIVTMEI